MVDSVAERRSQMGSGDPRRPAGKMRTVRRGLRFATVGVRVGWQEGQREPRNQHARQRQDEEGDSDGIPERGRGEHRSAPQEAVNQESQSEEQSNLDRE